MNAELFKTRRDNRLRLAGPGAQQDDFFNNNQNPNNVEHKVETWGVFKPAGNVEGFGKITAFRADESFQFNEADIKTNFQYKDPDSGKEGNLEVFLYANQDRFSLPDPLLSIANGHTGDGLSVDFNNYYGFTGNLKAVQDLSNFGGNSDNDFFALRLGRGIPIHNRDLFFQALWVRRNFSNSFNGNFFQPFEQVRGFALSYSFDKSPLTKKLPFLFNASFDYEILRSQGVGRDSRDNSAIGFRVSNLRMFRSSHWGTFRISRAEYEDFGNNYNNPLGRNDTGKKQYAIDNSYDFPGRAITLKYNAFMEFQHNTDSTRFMNHFLESDFELVHQLKYRMFFNHSLDPTKPDRERTKTDLQVLLEKDTEKYFWRMGYRIRFRNFNEKHKKQVLGVEFRYNFSKKIQFFQRVIGAVIERPDLVNETRDQRISIFSELSIDLGDHADLFFRVGEGRFGDFDLVRDDNMINDPNGDIAAQTKLSTQFRVNW